MSLVFRRPSPLCNLCMSQMPRLLSNCVHVMLSSNPGCDPLFYRREHIHSRLVSASATRNSLPTRVLSHFIAIADQLEKDLR